MAIGEIEHGVSIAICCHNSARRISQTLAHLKNQKVPVGLLWEVLLIDNASTDGTAGVARQSWTEDSPAPLRVVREAELGLTPARARALRESRYEIVGFVDDDNWVCAEWVALAARTMELHPEAGLVGSSVAAVLEGEPPPWFDAHVGSFAIGPPLLSAGECRQLPGAGLVLRKAAWRQAVAAGFTPVLAGRQGSSLTAGEDSELCLAIALAGWKLHHEPALQVRHFMPAERLRWDYLRKLYRGFGAARVYLPLYEGWWEENDYSRTARRSWLGRMMFSLRDLFGKRRWLPAKRRDATEGDAEALYAEWSIGFFLALLEEAPRYSQTARKIRRFRRSVT